MNRRDIFLRIILAIFCIFAMIAILCGWYLRSMVFSVISIVYACIISKKTDDIVSDLAIILSLIMLVLVAIFVV